MRNLIVAVVVLILAVVGIGYYQEWFTVTKKETPTRTDVHIEVDKDKIKKDNMKKQMKKDKMKDKMKKNDMKDDMKKDEMKQN